MRASVKPLTHWVIYKGYKVHFTARDAGSVAGVLTTPAGKVPFHYDPAALRISLPDATITINEYGWEIGRQEKANEPPNRNLPPAAQDKPKPPIDQDNQ
ncbi:MAG TPA: hypothetical protein VNK95_14560 [Caldilineaceae bacterium]|nr:hypothetical protein [Caldilineaceae bacterium]